MKDCEMRCFSIFKGLEKEVLRSTKLKECVCRNDEIKVNAYIIKLKSKILEQEKELFLLRKGLK